MKQSKNLHNRTFQTVRNNIWSALYDQLSRALNSTRAAHLGKIGKLFKARWIISQLFFSCGYIFFQNEFIRGFELRGSSDWSTISAISVLLVSGPNRLLYSSALHDRSFRPHQLGERLLR